MNIALFSLLGTVLLAGLLYTLLRTLRRPRQEATARAGEQTIIAIYQNRLQQAQQQFDNGELDQQEYEQAREELSGALGYELQNQAQNRAQPGKAGSSINWVLGIGIPLLAVSLYLLLGKPEAL
jgi:cytochrome c-type biogenesis protein CcmH